MTVAARMRKYRRRLALVRALDRARDHGVNVQAVFDDWAERAGSVTPIGVTDTVTADLFASRKEGERGD